MSIKYRSPDQRGGTRSVDLLQGATYAVILAILILALSPYEVTLFAMITLAAVFYNVANAVAQDE